jgi:hypothetical protein
LGGVVPATDPYYNDVILLLHMDGSSIIDSSNYNNLITASNTTNSTSQVKVGTHSAYFTGSNSYLTLPYNSAFDLGGSDFTIEFWAYMFNTNGKCLYWYGPLSTGWYIAMDGTDSNSLGWKIYNQAGAVVVQMGSMSGINTNTWQHVAFTRCGNLWTIWLDGVSKATATASVVFGNGGANSTYIGQITNNTWFWYGYIDEFRITKGVARYTKNFTPATTAFLNAGLVSNTTYDPFYNKVALTLHGEGSNGGTTFTDTSLNALTATKNGASITTSTSSYKVGTSSILFAASDQQLTWTSSQFAFGTGDFTIEGWYKFSDYANTNQGLFSSVSTGGAGTGIALSITNGAAYLYIGNDSSGSNVFSGTATGIADNTTFHHIAVVRSSGTMLLFVDGVVKGTVANTSNIDRSLFCIGTFYATTTGSATRGYA